MAKGGPWWDISSSISLSKHLSTNETDPYIANRRLDIHMSGFVVKIYPNLDRYLLDTLYSMTTRVSIEHTASYKRTAVHSLSMAVGHDLPAKSFTLDSCCLLPEGLVILSNICASV